MSSHDGPHMTSDAAPAAVHRPVPLGAGEKADPDIGGVLLRQVLPNAALLLVLNGCLAMLAFNPGLVNEQAARAALVGGCATLSLAHFWWKFGVLRRIDLTQVRTEEKLRLAMDDLERRVEERTAELKVANEAFQLNERRLQALLGFTEMGGASLQEIALFAMEETVQLTRSQVGYLAFTNDDESVLTMYAWSKSAMARCAIEDKPIIYPVVTTGLWGEAVRQRRPVITNDYHAPNPLKKGFPSGHVDITRHMNIPVFDGERIVAVAGVGNKEQDYDEADVRQMRLLTDGMWRLIRRKQTEDELATYREHLESLVEQRTLELKRSNLQLEREIADRKRMEARLVQTEKIALLGVLSAGVAHEINNPLAYVSNNVAVIERDFFGLTRLFAAYDEAAPVVEAADPEAAGRIRQVAEEIDLPYIRDNLSRILDRTRQGLKRVSDIVQNLRGFARLDQAAVDRIDIHSAIASSLEMIRGRLERRSIRVEQKYGKLPLVACAPAQINQVVLNILVNAMQAVESNGRDQGRIEIATRAQGDEVVIEVSDDGCGIPPEVLPRIFDPFFTTKPVGQGTGLGLSISNDIVTDHGGRFEVESTPGQGSRFRMVLPVEAKGRPLERPSTSLLPSAVAESA